MTNVSRENLAEMPGTRHAVKPNDLSWAAREFAGRIILTGPRNRPTLIKLEDVLKALYNGYAIKLNTNKRACWLEPLDGAKPGTVNYVVSWAILRRLQKTGLVDLVESKSKQVLTYEISKSGSLKHEALTLEKKALTSPPEPVAPALPVTTEQKTPEVTKSVKSLNIQASTISISKRQSVMTLLINSPDDLYAVKERLGLLPAQMLKEVDLPKETKKTRNAECFYCKTEMLASAYGKLPWRDACRNPMCQQRLKEDTKTWAELKKEGITVT